MKNKMQTHIMHLFKYMQSDKKVLSNIICNVSSIFSVRKRMNE